MLVFAVKTRGIVRRMLCHNVQQRWELERLPVQMLKDPTGYFGNNHRRVKCNSAEIVDKSKFVVMHNRHAGCLLRKQTATQLGLTYVGPQVSSVNCAVSSQSLRQRYPSVFDVVRKLTNYQQKISMNTDIEAVARPPSRIPFQGRI